MPRKNNILGRVITWFVDARASQMLVSALANRCTLHVRRDGTHEIIFKIGPRDYGFAARGLRYCTLTAVFADGTRAPLEIVRVEPCGGNPLVAEVRYKDSPETQSFDQIQILEVKAWGKNGVVRELPNSGSRGWLSFETIRRLSSL